MQRLQAYKFELIVTGEQQRQMRRFSGACRFVYNKALALQKERHEQGEKKLSAFELNNLLPQWKAEPVADQMTIVPLDSLTPREVFELCYQRQYASSPDIELVNCFEELETVLEHPAL
jgi:transposase